jgi:hypothetical protein
MFYLYFIFRLPLFPEARAAVAVSLPVGGVFTAAGRFFSPRTGKIAAGTIIPGAIWRRLADEPPVSVVAVAAAG